MNDISKITNLFLSWEDGNMTDYKFCSEMSKILKVYGLTNKGYRRKKNGGIDK